MLWVIRVLRDELDAVPDLILWIIIIIIIILLLISKHRWLKSDNEDSCKSPMVLLAKSISNMRASSGEPVSTTTVIHYQNCAVSPHNDTNVYQLSVDLQTNSHLSLDSPECYLKSPRWAWQIQWRRALLRCHDGFTNFLDNNTSTRDIFDSFNCEKSPVSVWSTETAALLWCIMRRSRFWIHVMESEKIPSLHKKAKKVPNPTSLFRLLEWKTRARCLKGRQTFPCDSSTIVVCFQRGLDKEGACKHWLWGKRYPRPLGPPSL